MAELVLRLRVAGNQEVQNALQALGQQAANVQAKVVQSGQGAERAGVDFNRLGRAASNVGALLSGTAAIASTFARGNKELQERLQSFSLVMASGSAVVRTFGAALQLVGKGPIGLIILGLGAAVTATVLLIRHWEQAKESALRVWGTVRDFFVRVFEGIATTFRGLGQIIIGVFRRDMGQIEAGSELLREGLGQLKDTAVDLGTGIKNLTVAGWERLTDLFGQSGDAAKKAAEELARLQELMQDIAHEATMHEIEQVTVPAMQRVAAGLKGVILEARDAPRAFREMAQAAEELWTRLEPLFRLSKFRPRGEGSPFADLAPDQGTIDALDAARQKLENLFIILTMPPRPPGGRPFIDLAPDPGTLKALEAAGQATQAWQTRAEQAAKTIRSAFEGAFTDILARGKSLGEAMTSLFEAIKQTIIRKIGEAMADKVWSFAKSLKLSTILPFPFNIIAGFIGLQHGGIVTRPTLAMVGEAGPEAVVPLRSGRGAGIGTTIINVNIPSGTTFLGSKEDVRRWFEAVAGPVLREQYAR